MLERQYYIPFAVQFQQVLSPEFLKRLRVYGGAGGLSSELV
jgi:hypothetical protein